MYTMITKSMKPTCEQLVCNLISTLNLKFENMKFGREMFKQVTHGNQLIDLLLSLLTLMHLCLFSRNSK